MPFKQQLKEGGRERRRMRERERENVLEVEKSKCYV